MSLSAYCQPETGIAEQGTVAPAHVMRRLLDGPGLAEDREHDRAVRALEFLEPLALYLGIFPIRFLAGQ